MFLSKIFQMFHAIRLVRSAGSGVYGHNVASIAVYDDLITVTYVILKEANI
jgi:hypothetical protein